MEQRGKEETTIVFWFDSSSSFHALPYSFLFVHVN